MPRSLISITQDLTGRLGLSRPDRLLTAQGDLLPQYVQMIYETASSLMLRHEWQELEKEITFTTVSGDEQINLNVTAPDFRYIKDGTIWNRTKRVEMRVVDAKQWAAAKSLSLMSFYDRYRIRGNKFLILNNTTADESISFEYVSKWFVEDTSGNPKARATRDDDLLLLDDELLILGAKWRFQKENGLEYGESFNDYEKLLQSLIGHDSPKETLNIGTRGRGVGLDPTVPEGNWGI